MDDVLLRIRISHAAGRQAGEAVKEGRPLSFETRMPTDPHLPITARPQAWRRIFARTIATACATALGVALAGTEALAQRNPCTRLHPMVDAVNFKGTDRVPKGVIAPIAFTERTSVFRRWFGWKIGPLTCLDSADLVSDAQAMEEDYRDRGFIEASVTSAVERHGDRRARVTFNIREGRPVAISRVAIAGLPGTVADSANVARRLLGRPMDDSVVNAVADSLQSLVRDAGHARARPRTVSIINDTANLQASVRMGFSPGPLTYIGRVGVQITPSGAKPTLSERAVRSAFGIRAGEQYTARSIADGQRELAALGLYRQVRVDTASVAGLTGASLDSISILLTAIEAQRRRARTTAGWATLDCFRTQTRFAEQNFAGLGHRLELTGRLSKIGLAKPFSGLDGLCAQRVRDDPFSQRLNYYVGATTTLRGLSSWRGLRWQPEVSLYSERRSSVGAYEQTTEIGTLVSTAHTIGDRLTATLQYAYTDSRTLADRAVSCTRFGFCRLEDVASFLLRSPQHSVAVSLVKNPLLPTDDPRSGYRWSLDTKFGHASIGRILPIDFGRITAEAAAYLPLSSWLTLATRAQIGGIIAPANRSFLLPPAERFYGGGQSSVRGYGQNLLGPGSYIVTAIDTITGANGTQYGVADPAVNPARLAPSGGNASWLANLELRTHRGWPGDLLRWVVFLDVGRVWNTRDVFSFTNADLRATPGIGVRLITPLGPFRMDIGYNPNGVVAGPAFLVLPGDLAGGTGRAICVSAGSDDPLVLGASRTPSSTSCPATFLPPRSFLSRIVFHFSLGNAF